MGDFLGFTFGDFHSSDLGITRVSGGDRYEEELHPEIKDRTAEVPGLNGEYYFGSDFGPKSFDIEFAFDNLTEQQFRKLRKVFGTKRIQKLIFDERPYKYYMAKLESPVELSYVCFDEPMKVGTTIEGIRYKTDDGYSNEHTVMRENGSKQRIYKGEGKMTLICYFPFAKSNFKVLPAEGSEEWAVSSGILSAEARTTAEIDIFKNGIIKTYNPGDTETGFRLYIPKAALGQQITLQYGEARLVIDPITLTEEEGGIIIDTNTGLIHGLISSTIMVPVIVEETGEEIQVEETEETAVIHIDSDGNASYTTSGNIYNKAVNSGYFFKLEPNEDGDYPTLQVTGASGDIKIFYDYLYF